MTETNSDLTPAEKKAWAIFARYHNLDIGLPLTRIFAPVLFTIIGMTIEFRWEFLHEYVGHTKICWSCPIEGRPTDLIIPAVVFGSYAIGHIVLWPIIGWWHGYAIKRMKRALSLEEDRAEILSALIKWSTEAFYELSH